MLPKKQDERFKAKPRGRPFKKRNDKSNGNEILDSTRHEGGNIGGVINPIINESIPTMDHCVNDPNNGIQLPFPIPQNEVETEKRLADDLELIESIDFKNGKNTLSIRFSRRHNRMFRVQIFLNGTNEIRPVTYTGATTGYAFWNILRGLIKNE